MGIINKRKWKLTVLLLLLFCLVFAGISLGNIARIKYLGINVLPGRAIDPAEIIYFLQHDPRWIDDRLGASNYRMASSGCLVACLAAAMHSMAYETDPGELNRLFTEKDVFTMSGEVIWYKIGEAVPGFGYTYKRSFNARTLENDLRKGRFPLVKVRYYGTGIFHWVMIVGSDSHDFLIMDPLHSPQELIHLGQHGNVYAYRVLVQE